MEGGRREKVDAGREKFAAYQKRKKKSTLRREAERGHGEDDEASVETPLSDTSVGATEGSARSSPSSTVSLSEPGGGLVQELKAKVAELEDVISGQQAALEALRRSSKEQQADLNTQLESYANRLAEYQGAVKERNAVIDRLTASLHSELSARLSLQQQGEHMAQEASLLKQQLQATSELVQGHLWDTGVRPDQYLALQNKVLELETSLAHTEQVEARLVAKELELQELSHELRDHKTRAAQEVQRLMGQVEQAQQKAALAAIDHSNKVTQLEENFGLQLRMKEEFRRRAEEDKRLLKAEYEKKVSALQEQLVYHQEGHVENCGNSSVEYGHLKQQVLKSTQDLDKSSRGLEETLEVNEDLTVAVGSARSDFEGELAAARGQTREQADVLWRDAEGLWGQLQEAVLANQQLSEQLQRERGAHERDVAAVNLQLQESHQQRQALETQLQEVVLANQQLSEQLQRERGAHERDVAAVNLQLQESHQQRQALETQLQEVVQAKQLQEESHKKLVDALNQRLLEAAEAEEKFPGVLAAHVGAFETDNLRYKEQVDQLNVRLQESLKTAQLQDKLLGDKNAELVVLVGQVSRLTTLLERAAESEASLKQQVECLAKQLQEAAKHQADAESCKLQNDRLNNELRDLNNTLLFREQKIAEYELEVTALKQKLEVLGDSRMQAEMYEEKLRKLNIEAQELVVYKDKAEALKSEIDVLKGDLNEMLEIFSDDDSTDVSSEHHVRKREIGELKIPKDRLRNLKEKIVNVLKNEESASSYLTQIADLKARLADSGKAAERQACEWEERISFYRDQLECLGGQICAVEQEHRAEVSRLQAAHRTELETSKASLEKKEHHDEELARLKEAHNMKLVELDETYKSRLTLQQELIHSLEAEVREHSEKLVCAREEIGRMECELEGSKQTEVEAAVAEEHRLCRQHVDVLKARLEQAGAAERRHIETVAACQMQVEAYKLQVEQLDVRYADELAASQRLADDLQHQLADRDEQVTGLRSQLDALAVSEKSLQDELSVAATQLQEVERLRAQLREKTDSEKSLHDKLAAAATKLQELDQLRAQLREKADSEKSLQDKLAAAATQLQEVERLRAQLREKADSEKSLHDELAAAATQLQELEQLRAQLSEKTDSEKSLQDKLAAAATQLQEVERLRAQLREKADSEKSLHDELAAAATQLQELEQLRAQLSEKTDSEKGLHDKLAAAATQLQELEQLRAQLGEKTDSEKSLQDKLAAAATQLQELEQLRAQLREKTDSEKSLHDKLAAAATQLQELEQLRAQLREKTDSEKSLHDKLAAAATQLQKVEQLRAQLSEKTDSEKSLHDKLAAAATQLQELEQLRAQLREKTDSEKSLHDKLAAAATQLQELEQLRAQLREKTDSEKSLHDKLAAAATQLQELEQLRVQLREKTDSEKSLQDKLAAAATQLQELQQLRAQLREKTDSEKSLQDKLAAAATQLQELERLRAQLSEKTDSEKSLHEELAAAATQLQELEQLRAQLSEKTDSEKSLHEELAAAATQLQELEQLRAQLGEKTDSEKSLHDKLAAAATQLQELEQLRAQLSEKTDSEKSLQDKLAAAATQLQELERLRAQLSEKTDFEKSLHEELAAAATQLQELEQLRAQLSEKTDSEKSLHEELAAAATQLQELEQLRAQLSEKTDSEKSLHEELAAAATQLQELEQLRAQLGEKTDSEKSLHDKLAAAATQLQELEQLRAQLGEKTDSEKSLQDKLAAAATQLQELQTSRQFCIAEVEGLTIRFDENLTEMESLLIEKKLLQQQLNTYKMDERELAANKPCTKCELTGLLELEIAKLKDDNASLEKSLNAAKAMEVELSAELVRRQSDIASLNMRNTQLEENAGATAELKNKVEELTVDKLKLESLLAGQEELVRGVQQLQNAGPDGDKQELVVQRLKITGLKAASDELHAAFSERIDELEREKSQLTLKVVKAKELLKRLKEEKTSTATRCSALEEECTRLRAENEERGKQWRERECKLEVESMELGVQLDKLEVEETNVSEKCSELEAESEKQNEGAEPWTQLEKRTEEATSVNSAGNKSALEQRLQEQNKEINVLAAKLGTVTDELARFKSQLSEREETLRSLEMKVKAGEELQATLENKLVDNLGRDNMVETVVLDLSRQTKEVVVLREKLRLVESRCEAVSSVKEKYEQELSDMLKAQEELERRLVATREEMGAVMFENERLRSKQVVRELDGLLDESALELQKDAGQEKEPESPTRWEEESALSWDDVLSDYERELLGQLAAHREQHVGLPELLVTSGLLQNTMHQQKQKLLKKLQEKVLVDSRLEEQRALYRDAQVKLCSLEHQLLERDNIQQGLALQKRLLQQDLCEIEDRLRNQESALRAQRATLEAEARAKELRARHWHLQARTAQVTCDAEGRAHEERLHDVCSQLDEAHGRALERLRSHFQEQLVARDHLLSSQLRAVLAVPRDQVPAVGALVSSKLQQLNGEAGGLEAGRVAKCAEALAAGIVQKLEAELEAVIGSTLATPGAPTNIQIEEQSVTDSCGSVLRAVEDSLYSEYSSALKAAVQAWRGRYQRELAPIVSALERALTNEEAARTSGEDSGTVAKLQGDAEALLATQEKLLSALEGAEAEVLRFHEASLLRLREELQVQHQQVLDTVQHTKTVVSSIQSRLDQASREAPLDGDLEKLRLELECKHTREMEELRQYFEQKCAEVEKRYSEEVFSQHSRKMSGSSAEELAGDVYFAAGDCGQRVPALTHICDSYSVEPSYKDLEERYRADYERRVLEYRDQLEAVKVSLEQKYSAEVAALRVSYQHQLQLQSAEVPRQLQQQKLDEVEEYFTENIIDELARMSSEAAIDKVCSEALVQGQVEQRAGMVDVSTETCPPGECAPPGLGSVGCSSALEWLRAHTTGAAMTRCLDELVASHEEELRALQSANHDQASRFELEHDVAERRLHERVEQARRDVVATLHHHLQALISESEKSPGPIPRELAALRERFVGPLQREVDALKQELATLKAQHGKLSLVQPGDSFPSVEIVARERDELRHALGVLRCVVRELLDYCARCEHELNATLVGELSPADRVHLSPDTSALASFVQDDAPSADASSVSTHFRSELNRCLARLHSEASSVLALSRSLAANKELVGEGLCEQVLRTPCRPHLRQPARRSVSEPSSPPQRLAEEFHQERERILEDARREKHDLQQQVEAADKQLRSTRQFLEEQASEREQEHEEFARQLAALQAQLRDRERERSDHARLLTEVECLDQQLRESAANLAESEEARARIQTDLDTAADKISTLREIIAELEVSVESRAANEESLKQQLAALESLLHQQDESHHQLSSELESLREGSGWARLAAHVSALEEQLSRHQLHVEQSGSGAVRRMKAQIQELEAAVGRKARELESLHCVGPSGSPVGSPLSEDVSIREQLEAMRCGTPERGHRDTPSPVPLPVEELHRLQEKLHRLCRAEESALKRVADLEMELCALRRREEEVSAERDVLQRQTEEQLLKISSLQARLDEQRRAVDSAHRLAVSELRSELLERTDEIHSLRDACDASHKEVKELRNMLEQARQQAAAQEAEMVRLLGRLQPEMQDRHDHQHAASAEEVGVLGALLQDAREEQASLQEELVECRSRCDQLRWFLGCYQRLDLLPHQHGLLSSLLQGLSPSQQLRGLQGEAQDMLGADPRLLAEDVLREAPDFSLSYSLPDNFHERAAKSLAGVSQDVTNTHQQLKEHEAECSSAQSVEEVNMNQNSEAGSTAVNHLQAENSDLRREVDVLKGDLSAARQERAALDERRVEELALRQEKQKLREDVEALKSKCSLVETLQRENSLLAKKAEELEAQRVVIETLRGENASLTEELDDLRRKLLSLKIFQDDNLELSRKVKNYESEFERLKNLEQEKMCLLEQMRELDSRCSVMENENHSQAREIVKLKTASSLVDSLREDNATLSKKVEELEEENARVCRTNKVLQEQCSVSKDLQSENSALSGKVVELSALREENASLSRKVADLEGHLEKLEEERRSQMRKLEELQIDGSYLRKLQQENSALSEKVVELSDLRKENASLSRKVADLEGHLEKLEEERMSQLRKLEELQIDGSYLRKLQQENLSLCRTVKDVQAECEAGKAQVSELQQQNSSLSQQVQELVAKCSRQDDRQGLLSAHEDQEQNILKLQEEKRVLQEAYLKVLQDMDNKQGSLDELSGQLQRELEESEKLDLSLLERLTSSDEDVPPGEVLEAALANILRKMLASGISVLTFSELSQLHQLVCSATAAAVVQDGRAPLCHTSSTGPEELEALLRKERQLAQELRAALGREQAHTQELASHLRLQSQLLADMQVQQASIQGSIARYTDLLEMERSKTLSLEEKLTAERLSCKRLHAALEAERQKLRAVSVQDCSLLESLRRQLDVALESEERLRGQLQRAAASADAALQERCAQLALKVSRLEQQLSREREAARSHQGASEQEVAIVRSHLEAVEANLVSLVRDGAFPKDDDSDVELRRSIACLKEKLQELSTAQVTDVLEERLAPLRQREQNLLRELGAAQRQAGELRAAVVVRDQRLAALGDELASRDKRLRVLGRELTASRCRQAELERRLTPEGLEGSSASNNNNNNNNVIVNGKEDVIGPRDTNKEVASLQAQLRVLQEREKVNHAAWAEQKAALEAALGAAHVPQPSGRDCTDQPVADMEERMTHLFGKYLRCESYRKSLVWQKRYLLVVLGGYQDCHGATLGQLALHAGHAAPPGAPPHPRRRFRVAVVAVVVIQRMRYLVRRWSQGRRVGRSAIVSRPPCECVGPASHLSYHAPRRKWGRGPIRDEGAPWHSSGQQQPWRLGEDGCVTLLEPGAVAQFAVRSDNIHRRLGLATST